MQNNKGSEYEMTIEMKKRSTTNDRNLSSFIKQIFAVIKHDFNNVQSSYWGNYTLVRSDTCG